MPRPSQPRVYEPFLLPALLCASPALLAGAGCGLDSEPAAARLPVRAMSAEISLAAPVPAPVLGRWPAAAFDGNQYLAVWEDLRAGRPALYGGRVAAGGAALDPIGFPILDAVREPAHEEVYEPAVAFGGGTFLVAVQADGEMLGVRVSPAGEVLDPGGFVISTAVSPLSQPALAWGGEAFLVAWSVGTEGEGSLDSGVYRARVAPDGAVLDPGGVRAYERQDAAWPMSASFDGANTLLSWTEGENIYAGRIAPDGTLVDASPFLVHAAGPGLRMRVGAPAGFDGTNHVIAWALHVDAQRGWPTLQYRASRVTPEGEVLDPDGIQVAEEIAEFHNVKRLHLQAGGGRSVVLWSGHSGEGPGYARPVGAAEVAADGTVRPHPAHELTSGLDATLAAHPDGALLLWRDGHDRFQENPSIVGARLDAAGAPVAGSASPASPASHQEVRAVAYGDQRFLVLWTDSRDPGAEGKTLYGARLAADGTLLDTEPIKLSDIAAHAVDVVFDGANFVVTWVHVWGDGGRPFQSMRVSPGGALLDPEPLPEVLEAIDRFPAIVPDGALASASDGARTLFAGRDNDALDGLSVALLGQDGVWSTPVHVLPYEERSSVNGLAMAFGGDGYLVLWHSQYEVFGQRVDVDGRLVGEAFRIAQSDEESIEQIRDLAVAFGGGSYLIVWETREGLYALRMLPDGQGLDPTGERIVSPGIAPNVGITMAPSLVWGGERFILAWRALADESDASSVALHGAELDTAGEVLRQFVISEQPESEAHPFLAAGTFGEVLVAYSRFVPGAPNDALRARAQLLAAGTPPPPGADAGAPGSDAGVPAEPPGSDAGVPAEPPGYGDPGCGCRAGGGEPAPAASLLLAAMLAPWLLRRRRAR